MSSQLMIIGEVQHPDVCPSATWLHERGCEHFDNCESAVMSLQAHHRWVDAILLFQTRPGQFAASQVERLHRAVPLAQLLSVEGVWCEGQFRKGRPLPGVPHIYWHQWEPRFRRWFASSKAGPVWQRTSTLAEMLDQFAVLPAAAEPLFVAIACEDLTTFSGLARLLEEMGSGTVWLPPRSHVQAAGINQLIWCGRLESASDEFRLQQLRQDCGDCPTIALMDFPRPHECERLGELGVDRVLATPYTHADLAAALQAVRAKRPSSLPASA